MKLRRVIFLLAVMVTGIAIGLFYGWVVDPVTYMNTSADTLRIDYQTDIVVMIAEIYSRDGNLDHAINRLAWLDHGNRTALLKDCLSYAKGFNFSETDVERLSLLLNDVGRYAEDSNEPR